MRLIKEIKENRRKGLGVPLGPKVRRLRVWGSEGSKTSNITQHHKTLQDRRSVSNSKVQRLRKLFSGFPLQWHYVITLNLRPKGNCSHVRCATQVRPWHDKSHAGKPTCRHWPAGVICCDIFFKQSLYVWWMRHSCDTLRNLRHGDSASQHNLSTYVRL